MTGIQTYQTRQVFNRSPSPKGNQASVDGRSCHWQEDPVGAAPTRLGGSCCGGWGWGRTKAAPGTPAGEDQCGPTGHALPPGCGSPGVAVHVSLASAQEDGLGCFLVSGSLPGTPGPQHSLLCCGLCTHWLWVVAALRNLHGATIWLGCPQAHLEGLEVQHRPRTDPQGKNSAAGRIIVTCGSIQGFGCI